MKELNRLSQISSINYSKSISKFSHYSITYMYIHTYNVTQCPLIVQN